MHSETGLPSDARIVRVCYRRWQPAAPGTGAVVVLSGELRVPTATAPRWSRVPGLAWHASRSRAGLPRFGQLLVSLATWPALLGVLAAARRAEVLGADGTALMVLARHPLRDARRRSRVGAAISIAVLSVMFLAISSPISVVMVKHGHTAPLVLTIAVFLIATSAGMWRGVNLRWLNLGTAAVDSICATWPYVPAVVYLMAPEAACSRQFILLLRHIVAHADDRRWALATPSDTSNRASFEQLGFAVAVEFPHVLVRGQLS